MKKNKIFAWKYFLFDFIRINGIPALLWFRPKKYYLHEEDRHQIKGGALLISNHISLVDPMYLLLSIRSRRLHIICMDELLHSKFQRWIFIHACLCIPITRSNITLSQVKEIITRLKNGEVVSMFPEGKINESGEGLQKFKSGMVMMAYRGNAPIIPLYIKRRKHFYSRLEVAIGSPIDVASFKSGDVLTKEDNERACIEIEKREKELEQFMLSKEKKK